VVDVEVLQLGPRLDVRRYLLDPVVGCFEVTQVLDQLLVLEDLLGQLLHEDGVEGHVESLDVLLPSRHPLGDVSTQLWCQSDHLAAGSHRRDGLLILLTWHRPDLARLSTYRRNMLPKLS